jgi:hypothetical protein
MTTAQLKGALAELGCTDIAEDAGRGDLVHRLEALLAVASKVGTTAGDVTATSALSGGGTAVASVSKASRRSCGTRTLAWVSAMVAVGLAALQSNGVSDGTIPLFHMAGKWGLHSDELPSMSGQIALITGASSGLGLGVARALSRREATVIVTARDEAKCDATLAALRDHAGDAAKVSCVVLELLDLAAVEAAAAQLLGKVSKLDMLVLNAGVMAPPTLERSVDDLEIQFQTNHLSHYWLVRRLLPALRQASNPRVVAVSSVGHYAAPSKPLLSRAELNDEGSYSPFTWYGWSKLCVRR